MADPEAPIPRRRSIVRVLARWAVVVMAGPFVVVGGAVAAWALAEQFLSGWVPSQWIVVPTDGESFLDSLFGTTQGSGRRYLNLVAGALVAWAGVGLISRVWRR